MKRTLLAATTLPLMLLAGTALAQQNAAQTAAQTAGNLVEVEDESQMVDAFNLSVDDVDDMEIYSANGDEIGDVEEVLMDADGKMVALVAEVGGFLGIGEREVMLRFDQVEQRGDDLVVDMTEEQVEQLPEWDD